MSQNEFATGLAFVLVSGSLSWSFIGICSKANKWVVFTTGIAGFIGTALTLLTVVLPMDILHSMMFAMGTLAVATEMTELAKRAT